MVLYGTLRQMITSSLSIAGFLTRLREKRSGMKCGTYRTTTSKNRTYNRSNTKHINTTRKRGDSEMKLPSFKEIFKFMFMYFALCIKLGIAAVIFIAVVMGVFWLIIQML